MFLLILIILFQINFSYFILIQPSPLMPFSGTPMLFSIAFYLILKTIYSNLFSFSLPSLLLQLFSHFAYLITKVFQVI